MDGANVLAEYIYNGKGQTRLPARQGAEKWIASANNCTVFHYDLNGMLIAESTSSGNVKAEYVYLNGQPLAKVENNNIYYYHNDHLGTPMLMTDSSASTVWQGEYLPFGEEYSVTGSITNNIRFPGQYYDSETGLHYNYFRDYNPMIGRYVEADPIGIEQGMNHLYGYVGNNPVNWIDPTGEAIQMSPALKRAIIKCATGTVVGAVIEAMTGAAQCCYKQCGYEVWKCDITKCPINLCNVAVSALASCVASAAIPNAPVIPATWTAVKLFLKKYALKTVIKQFERYGCK